MFLLAQLTMHPGGVIAWIGVGLISGWLAGLVMSGGGFGVVGDIVLGLAGALAGGLVSSFFLNGDAGFWASTLVAFVGACTVISVAYILAPGRTARR